MDLLEDRDGKRSRGGASSLVSGSSASGRSGSYELRLFLPWWEDGLVMVRTSPLEVR
jgi:hypothetical protein